MSPLHCIARAQMCCFRCKRDKMTSCSEPWRRYRSSAQVVHSRGIDNIAALDVMTMLDKHLYASCSRDQILVCLFDSQFRSNVAGQAVGYTCYINKRYTYTVSQMHTNANVQYEKKTAETSK